MKDPLKHCYIVHSYDDGFLHSRLARWLMSLNIQRGQWRTWLAHDRNVDCNYNASIDWLLHRQKVYDHFVICDCDMQPHESHMRDFWSSEADIVGARFPTECENAFAAPDVIHAGLWRSNRAALQAIEDKFGTWFEWERNEKKTKTVSCVCQSLVRKARKIGLTVQQAGYAMHVPRRKVR